MSNEVKRFKAPTGKGSPWDPERVDVILASDHDKIMTEVDKAYSKEIYALKAALQEILSLPEEHVSEQAYKIADAAVNQHNKRTDYLFCSPPRGEK